MNDPLLTIIIPVYNQWELTRQCLESLRLTTPGDFYEVVVVDNGSTDPTLAACPSIGNSLFPGRFTYVRNATNLGFGPACNRGANEAKGTFLFFLNNDTLLTDNWWPPLQTAFAEDADLGAAGPLLLFPGSGRVQHVGVTFVPGGQAQHLYSNFPAGHPLVHKKREIKALTGAALLVPASVFFDCSGFHPGYVNGWEDVDLCCEIRKRNMSLRCITNSMIYHITSQTSGRFDKEGENYELLIRRQGDTIRPDLHRFLHDDGYRAELTPCLRLYGSLPPAGKHALEARMKSFDPEKCLSMLEEEPLWNEGYNRLAGYLETHGKWEDALALRHLQGLFHPLKETLIKELNTARKALDQRIIDLTLTRLQEIDNRLEKKELLIQAAEATIKRAQQWGDPALETIYRKWLTAR